MGLTLAERDGDVYPVPAERRRGVPLALACSVAGRFELTRAETHAMV
jgi:hypothetical protein